MRRAVARRKKGYEHEIEIRGHRLIADEQEEDGGHDAGPRPTEYLAASLASCTATTIEMYLDRKDVELGDIEVAVDYEPPAKVGDKPRIDVKIRLDAELTDELRERVLVIAGKCPVHRTLTAQDVEINDALELIGA
jgi:putative redox protein